MGGHYDDPYPDSSSFDWGQWLSGSEPPQRHHTYHNPHAIASRSAAIFHSISADAAEAGASGFSAFSQYYHQSTPTTHIEPEITSAPASDSQPQRNSGEDDNDDVHVDDMGRSLLAVIVAIPIIIVLAFVGLIFYCLRTRKKRKERENAEMAVQSLPMQQRRPSNILPPQQEGLLQPPAPHSQRRVDRYEASAPVLPPVMVSERNNAYMTGLDVDASSVGSRRQSQSHGYSRAPAYEEAGDYGDPARRSLGGTFIEPPPPYRKSNSVRSAASRGSAPSYRSGYERSSAGLGGSSSREPMLSPFDDPEYEVEVADGLLYNPRGDNGEGEGGGEGGFERSRSPFADPVVSPISDLGGHFGERRRRDSDVSDLGYR